MSEAVQAQQWDLVIEAGRTERHYWRDLLRYGELFWFLAWRDILVRYKQTVFGAAWAIVQPLMTMVVFSLVFGRMARMPSEGHPYPLLVYAAMMPWEFFSSTFTLAANSMLVSANLIAKTYFPRIIVPASKGIVSFVDFAISMTIYVALMIYYRVPFSVRVLAVPPLLLLTFVTATGAGILVAALNVKYRDFRYVVPFIVRLGLYVSPVGFASSVVPERWKLLYSLNPMVGVIEGFRWALLGGSYAVYVPGFFLSIAVSLGVLALAVWYFRLTERTFADVI